MQVGCDPSVLANVERSELAFPCNGIPKLWRLSIDAKMECATSGSVGAIGDEIDVSVISPTMDPVNRGHVLEVKSKILLAAQNVAGGNLKESRTSLLCDAWLN